MGGVIPETPPQFRDIIISAANKNGVPPQLLSALLWAESSFSPDIIYGRRVSSAGAQGIAQFMPGTAAAMGVNPLDPASAIDGAARYLAQHYRQFGDWGKALAAYNAGPGNVQKYGGVPPFAETQNYVAKIMGRAGVTPTTTPTAIPTPTTPMVAGARTTEKNNSFLENVADWGARNLPYGRPGEGLVPTAYSQTPKPLSQGVLYSQAPQGSAANQYMVKPGDTLWGIAQQYLGNGNRWQELGYKGVPTQLPIGQRINIPTASRVSTPAPMNASYAPNASTAQGPVYKPPPPQTSYRPTTPQGIKLDFTPAPYRPSASFSQPKPASKPKSTSSSRFAFTA